MMNINEIFEGAIKEFFFISIDDVELLMSF